MPGSIVFKPIEANLTHNTDLLSKMNPYCAVNVGGTVFKGQVCKKGGKHPIWNDAITLPATNDATAIVEIMDKDKITKDDHIGSFMINLQEVQSMGVVNKWYPLTYKNKPAGEILVESFFQPDSSYGNQTSQGGFGMAQTGFTGSQAYQGEQLGVAQTGFSSNQAYQSEQIGLTQSAGFAQEQIVNKVTGFEQGSHMYTEQRQVVEPHTFMKEVEVVETRPVLKEIEVMENVKVLRDVQVTEAVPVTKQIEVTEPQVVIKEVEVIEPRVVNKTIQVIENVPVKRQVEVIEPRTVLQEVHTFEPQTFTRQIEVTENVPVKRTVEVSEPYTLHKNVEFVEPVITTKTITREIQQPVIVDESYTTHVGPASLVGVGTEYRQEGFVDQFSQVRITEEQRFLEQERLRKQEKNHHHLGNKKY